MPPEACQEACGSRKSDHFTHPTQHSTSVIGQQLVGMGYKQHPAQGVGYKQHPEFQGSKQRQGHSPTPLILPGSLEKVALASRLCSPSCMAQPSSGPARQATP